MKRLLVAALRAYKRWVSPLLPPACRFAPTCSEYCRLAIEDRGVAAGVALGLARLARCQPLCPGGIDLP